MMAVTRLLQEQTGASFWRVWERVVDAFVAGSGIDELLIYDSGVCQPQN